MFGSSSVNLHDADLCQHLHRDFGHYQHHDKYAMENGRGGGGRGESLPGRVRGSGSGTWTQCLVAGLLIFSAFLFFFFQVASLMPRRSGPRRFPWSSNATRDMAVYLRPNQHTAILQPTYLCPETPFVLFVVPSSINNTREREAIRRTWGQWAGSRAVNDVKWSGWGGDFKKRPFIQKLKVPTQKTSKIVFLLGTGKGQEKVSNNVRAESMAYGDLVVEDFVDSYTNLTLKTVFMLKWVSQNCPTANFIMKTDDDIFVNVPNLHRTLSSLTKPKLLTGNLICGARPIHDLRSKWYTPQYMFREGYYPNYLSGTAYVFSGDLVKPLLSAALSTPYFHLEDVFLTGICARKIGVRPTDNFGFSYQTRSMSPCVFKEVVMGHEVLASQMMKLWNLLNQPATIAKCRPVKKSKLKANAATKCVWR